MPVYIDDAENKFGRYVMCHMCAIPPDEHLHVIAKAAGLKRTWFQPSSFPHYDVSLRKRDKCISLGAIPVTERECAKLRLEYKEAMLG